VPGSAVHGPGKGGALSPLLIVQATAAEAQVRICGYLREPLPSDVYNIEISFVMGPAPLSD
jgi:hypothetical protein